MTELSPDQKEALRFLRSVQVDPATSQAVRDDIENFLNSPPPPSITLHIPEQYSARMRDLCNAVKFHCATPLDCVRRPSPCLWMLLYPELTKDCQEMARKQVLADMEAEGQG